MIHPVLHPVVQKRFQTLLAQPVVQTAARILGPENVRLVGGAVRDALCGTLAADLDMATRVPPDQAFRRLASAGYNVIPTGLKHGTITLVLHGVPLEITALREDTQTDGRHAKVRFTRDWQADAARRDFSINALSVDTDGKLHDYFGGLEDLKAGRVQFVGEPGARLQEDYLRLLRYFRFYARFAKREPDAALKACLSACAVHIDALSGERIAKEVFALLVLPGAARALDLMNGLGVSQYVFGCRADPAGFRELARREAQKNVQDPLRRLAAVTGCRAARLKASGNRLRLSNKAKARLADLSRGRRYEFLNFSSAPPALYRDALCRDALYRDAYRFGTENLTDALFFQPVFRPGLVDALKNRVRPVLPVSGQDLIALGIDQGVTLGRTLARLRNLWIDSGFTLSKAELLEKR